MNRKEMRELDCYLAEHVMGWQNDVEGSGYFYEETLAGPPRQIDYHDWQPTLDPAAAMMVLEKCAIRADNDCKRVAIRPYGRAWVISAWDKYEDEIVEADTLPLAIALFAKQLFHAQEKETKVH